MRSPPVTTKADYARAYRHGLRYTVPVEPFRTWAREAWRDLTLGEMAAITGLQPSTLRTAMWGKGSKRLGVKTAAGITVLRMMLVQRASIERTSERRDHHDGLSPG